MKAKLLKLPLSSLYKYLEKKAGMLIMVKERLLRDLAGGEAAIGYVS